MAKHPRIVMVGAFPPPVCGMATVNLAVYEKLMQLGTNPFLIDLAASSLDRSFSIRIRRLPKVLCGLIHLFLQHRDRAKTLYMSLSGGLGQWYEILFLLIGRIYRMRIYLHHHSFSYLYRRSRLTKFLLNVAGPSATHITLCPAMAIRLSEIYTSVSQVTVVSNATFLLTNAHKKLLYRSHLQTVGFIGNISAEKGVFNFLNLIDAIVEEKIAVQAKIAGPFQDHKTEQEVRRWLAKQSQVEYVGPKYGLDKEAFFATIDVLVFPTHYVNEAEPLTIHEAMSYGLPVIACGRGCISEIVGEESGKVIDPVKPFGPAALTQIKEWIAFPQVFEAVSRSALKHFSETLSTNTQQFKKLIAEIASVR